MVAVNESILNRRTCGFASRRRLGALCAVQESAQSEKSVDRFPTAVLRFPRLPLWFERAWIALCCCALIIDNPGISSVRLGYLAVQQTSFRRALVVTPSYPARSRRQTILHDGGTFSACADRGASARFAVPAKGVPERSVPLLTGEDHGTA